jgi:hypothetical protein
MWGVLAGVLAASASAGWSRPAELSAPTSLSVLNTQVASSPTGAAAVSFNEVNLDAQQNASAFVALASPHGAFGAAGAVPGVQEILAIAYTGSTLELLTASGPPRQPCCSVVQVIRRAAGSGFGPPQTLVTGAGGGTSGRLVPLSNGRMLAVIAAPERLWASEARGAGRFGPVHGLTPEGSAPAAVAVTGTVGGGSAVVWTQGAAQDMFGASAGPGSTPSRRHTLLAAPTGHAIDGVQLVSGPAGLTVGWTEDYNDASGAYHAQAMASDLVSLSKPLAPRALSAPADIASELALATDGNGEEVATWEVCSPSSLACSLQSKVRNNEVVASKVKKKKKKAKLPPARWFGPVSNLGSIDPGQSPALTTASDRESLLGWIAGGDVVIAELPPGATHVGTTRRHLSGGLAADLALDFGPSGAAVATWTQGTYAPDVFASVLR